MLSSKTIYAQRDSVYELLSVFCKPDVNILFHLKNVLRFPHLGGLLSTEVLRFLAAAGLLSQDLSNFEALQAKQRTLQEFLPNLGREEAEPYFFWLSRENLLQVQIDLDSLRRALPFLESRFFPLSAENSKMSSETKCALFRNLIGKLGFSKELEKFLLGKNLESGFFETRTFIVYIETMLSAYKNNQQRIDRYYSLPYR